MLSRIANREDPDQTASSDLGLCCLSRLVFKILELKNDKSFYKC